MQYSGVLVYRILCILFILITSSCTDDDAQQRSVDAAESDYYQIQGNAQGTTYSITYQGDFPEMKYWVDSILSKFDYQLSTYRNDGWMERLNGDSTSVDISEAKYLVRCFKMSKKIYSETDEYFNPAVKQLVAYWKFDNNNWESLIDSAKVEQLRLLSDFSNINMIDNMLVKNSADNSLDFNAIAQGYSVDVISTFLKELGIKNYLIEIGGEMMSCGKNPSNTDWIIGIEKPTEDNSDNAPQLKLRLQNKGLATSGNYRKYIVVDGAKYGHTINPKSGYPAKNNLLSVTVIAESSAEADAYATAFMAMGTEKAITICNEKNILAYFIEYDENSYKEKFTAVMNELIVP